MPTTATPSAASPRTEDTATAATTPTSTLGNPRGEAGATQDDPEAEQPDREGPGVGLREAAEDPGDVADEALRIDREAEQLGQLADDDRDRQPGQVAHPDRHRQQVGDETQAADPGGDADRPDHQCEHPRESDAGMLG
jgi:hypothetical protein